VPENNEVSKFLINHVTTSNMHNIFICRITSTFVTEHYLGPFISALCPNQALKPLAPDG
jgi:hypothetical protein